MSPRFQSLSGLSVLAPICGDVRKALENGGVKSDFATTEFEVVRSTPEEFVGCVASDRSKFEAIPKGIGLPKLE